MILLLLLKILSMAIGEERLVGKRIRGDTVATVGCARRGEKCRVGDLCWMRPDLRLLLRG